ncbi:MAG: hypothetical protein KKH61_20515 [Gammaproteobacteria bacterium]|nr:hypothetical protein [Gammaproteobacteria bacterium]
MKHYSNEYLSQVEKLKRINRQVKDAHTAGNDKQVAQLTRRFEEQQEQMRNGKK